MSDHEIYNNGNCSSEIYSDIVQKAFREEGLPEPAGEDPLLKVSVVTDVRFPNEYTVLKKTHSVHCVQIKRVVPGVNKNNHSSNQFYPEIVPDECIFNDSTENFVTVCRQSIEKLILKK